MNKSNQEETERIYMNPSPLLSDPQMFELQTSALLSLIKALMEHIEKIRHHPVHTSEDSDWNFLIRDKVKTLIELYASPMCQPGYLVKMDSGVSDKDVKAF